MATDGRCDIMSKVSGSFSGLSYVVSSRRVQQWDELIDQPVCCPLWFTVSVPQILVCWRTAVLGVCTSIACVCVSEGDIDWSYFCFATWQMQAVHSRNVNAHTCLGGECEASLMIASVEPNWETDKVGGRTLLEHRYPLQYEWLQWHTISTLLNTNTTM